MQNLFTQLDNFTSFEHMLYMNKSLGIFIRIRIRIHLHRARAKPTFLNRCVEIICMRYLLSIGNELCSRGQCWLLAYQNKPKQTVWLKSGHRLLDLKNLRSFSLCNWNMYQREMSYKQTTGTVYLFPYILKMIQLLWQIKSMKCKVPMIHKCPGPLASDVAKIKCNP